MKEEFIYTLLLQDNLILNGENINYKLHEQDILNIEKNLANFKLLELNPERLNHALHCILIDNNFLN